MVESSYPAGITDADVQNPHAKWGAHPWRPPPPRALGIRVLESGAADGCPPALRSAGRTIDTGQRPGAARRAGARSLRAAWRRVLTNYTRRARIFGAPTSEEVGHPAQRCHGSTWRRSREASLAMPPTGTGGQAAVAPTARHLRGPHLRRRWATRLSTASQLAPAAGRSDALAGGPGGDVLVGERGGEQVGEELRGAGEGRRAEGREVAALLRGSSVHLIVERQQTDDFTPR